MSTESCNVISGPQEGFSVPEGSVGKYLFECLKKRDPRHVIVIDAMTGTTFDTGQMLNESLKVTKVLQDLDIQKSDVISIVMENSLKYFVPQLAAFYMGVTAHLLNPLYSTGELKHAFTISKPKLIICCQLSVKNVIQAVGQLQFANTKIILSEGTFEEDLTITSLDNLLKNTPTINPERFEPDTFDCSNQGALILMSSGTTGLPKGVLLTHKNVTAGFGYLLYEEYMGTRDTDITVFVLPFFHILGFIIQIISIISGMRIILLTKFKPNLYLESIQKYKPTILYLVPSMLQFLSRNPLVNDYDISSVKDIMVGAAAVGSQLVMDAAEKFPNTSVRQAYGTTEAGGCTVTRKGDIKIGSAGVLVPHMFAKVWNVEMEKNEKPSKIGELCFKGPMVMKGYVGNESDTSSCVDEEGFLHSGDLGYFDENGHMHVVDRIKELIKYKGFQVPPAELEVIILTHPAVKDCGVIGIPDERAGQVPLAYVVKQDDVDVSHQDIVDYVAERISIQKRLYGGVRFIDEIPKNATGKVLRRKLMGIFNNAL